MLISTRPSPSEKAGNLHLPSRWLGNNWRGRILQGKNWRGRSFSFSSFGFSVERVPSVSEDSQVQVLTIELPFPCLRERTRARSRSSPDFGSNFAIYGDGSLPLANAIVLAILMSDRIFDNIIVWTYLIRRQAMARHTSTPRPAR